MAGDNLNNGPKRLPFQVKATDIFVNNMLKNVVEDGDINTLMQVAEDACPGLIRIEGPIKEEASIRKKIDKEYGGDFYRTKDVVRMTLIAADQDALNKVQNKLLEHCRDPSKGLRKIKNEMTTADDLIGNACGYSGLNFVVTLRNGRNGEIQGNIPNIMFGKMSRESFCKAFGNNLKHDELRMRYRIKCGMGHGLYKIWDNNPNSIDGKRAAALSKKYYAFLREKSPDPKKGDALNSDLVSIKKEFLRFFLGVNDLDTETEC